MPHSRLRRPMMRGLVSLPALALLAGCATTPGATSDADPLEGFNRAMWGVNRTADRFLLKPAAQVYRFLIPKPLRQGISHGFANVEEPFSAINNILQGKPKRAARNLKRFVVNSTLGIGGLFDPATKAAHIRPAVEDFGQTLAVWGVKSGPYLMLPLLGPTTLRDGVGSGVAMFTDPFPVCIHYCTDLTYTQRLAISAGGVISARSDAIDSGADSLIDSSLDSYATVKSAFLQRRRAQILNQDEDGTSTPTADPSGAAATSDDAALDAAVADLKAEAGDQPAAAPPAAPKSGVTPPEATPPAPPAAAPATPGTATPPPPPPK